MNKFYFLLLFVFVGCSVPSTYKGEKMRKFNERVSYAIHKADSKFYNAYVNYKLPDVESIKKNPDKYEPYCAKAYKAVMKKKFPHKNYISRIKEINLDYNKQYCELKAELEVFR